MNNKINPLVAIIVLLVALGVIAFAVFRSTEAPIGGVPTSMKGAMAASGVAPGPQKAHTGAVPGKHITPAPGKQMAEDAKTAPEAGTKSAENAPTAPSSNGATVKH